MYRDDFLEKKLNERRQNDSFRMLKLPEDKIDFCSNDYLGIVQNSLLKAAGHTLSSGATGSRLLSGNYPLIESAESKLAAFHQAEAALIFNSGYDANLGLLSSVPQKGDTILYDQLSHASIRDGIRLSFANSFSFAHNDLADLEKKLQQASGTVFIVTESVFSMDGDFCPLEALCLLAAQYHAHIIIDEPHATGVIGEKGEGLVQQLALQHKLFARVHTFGKACGCHGAVVLGSKTLRDYLINFARSFVFSTALPAQAVAMIMASYDLFPQMTEEREHLQKLIRQFGDAKLSFEKKLSGTPIQVVMIPGNSAVKKVAGQLQENGLDIRPILYPTVPKGKERLRIVLHSFNTEADLSGLINALSSSGNPS